MNEFAKIEVIDEKGNFKRNITVELKKDSQGYPCIVIHPFDAGAFEMDEALRYRGSIFSNYNLMRAMLRPSRDPYLEIRLVTVTIDPSFKTPDSATATVTAQAPVKCAGGASKELGTNL